MSKRAIAISLKIPDNTAYTAAVALRRLGLDVEGVERSEIWFFDDRGVPDGLIERIKSDERIFNPNKHRATLLGVAAPREGEVWIEPLERLGSGPSATAWRLYGTGGVPLDRVTLAVAVERLLCNPAIERPTF
jgi:hypothetical protein